MQAALPAPVAPSSRAWSPAPWMRQAAATIAACLVSAALAWTAASWSAASGRIEQEVLSAHLRSLVQDSPIQVASSDSHTVKPWFAGKLDVSPDVKDLTAAGFPLIGGRLDVIDGRRVGAVVYTRNKHVVNVFAWASAGASAGAASSDTPAAPRASVLKGYNVLSWVRNGVAYHAISDLNVGELRTLQGLL
jgi:anti-sigma factor RsiW